MKLILINQSKVRMPRSFIDRWLSECRGALASRGVPLSKQKELTVVFMGKSSAKKLNFQFRHRNYATDVLSFEGDDQGTLGELILCPEVLLKQASEHDLSFRQELGYMLIHGVLHLLGFDHEGAAAEAQRMFALQDEIFDKLCRKFWK